jgi:hypothetical protein
MVHAVSQRGQRDVIRLAKQDALSAIARIWDKRLAIQSRRKASLLQMWRVLDKSLPPEPWRRSLQRIKEQIRRRLVGGESASHL